MPSEILMVDTKADLNLYKQSSYLGQSSCCGPAESRKDWPTEFAELDFNEWVGKFHPSQYWLNKALMICVASFQIYAVKHSAVEQAMS
jgi:arsenite methyltransferase